MSSYDDLTRAAARIADVLCETAFEMADANPVELTELFEQLKATGWDDTLIAAIKHQVEVQKKLNAMFAEEDNDGA